MTTLQEVISRRVSVRTYQSQPAPTEELQAVLRAGEQAETLTSIDMRFHLCSDDELGRNIKGIIGNYGKTIHAPRYIVLTSREGAGYLTDAGYRFEQMVLEATRRTLGTCWVGLMFKEGEMRATLRLDSGWRVVVLSPIGIPHGASFMNRMVRSMAGSDGRMPAEKLFFWQRHGEPLPGDLANNVRLRPLFDAIRRAPSWMNRQPWRFVLGERDIRLYKFKQRDREGKDYHRLDCGIAMCHLHFMARELGMQGRWDLGPFEVPGAPGAEPVGTYMLEASLRQLQ